MAKNYRKRDAILTCLRETDQHPTAEWIYTQLKPQIPDLALATVYRNLILFKEQGLARSLGTVGGVERFDGRLHPHTHFICSQCHSVMDMENVEIPTALHHCAVAYGRVEEIQLNFTGLCQRCCGKEKAV